MTGSSPAMMIKVCRAPEIVGYGGPPRRRHPSSFREIVSMSILTQLPESLYLGQHPAFQTTSTKFDLDTARAMAWSAQLAYETDDPAKVGRILAAWNWTLRGYHSGPINGVLPLKSSKGFIAA